MPIKQEKLIINKGIKIIFYSRFLTKYNWLFFKRN